MPPLIAGMGGGLSHQRIRCVSRLRLRPAPQSACALAIDVEQSPFAFARAERWPSGRRHQIANLAYWVTGTEGSNPSLSASFIRVFPDLNHCLVSPLVCRYRAGGQRVRVHFPNPTRLDPAIYGLSVASKNFRDLRHMRMPEPAPIATQVAA